MNCAWLMLHIMATLVKPYSYTDFSFLSIIFSHSGTRFLRTRKRHLAILGFLLYLRFLWGLSFVSDILCIMQSVWCHCFEKLSWWFVLLSHSLTDCETITRNTRTFFPISTFFSQQWHLNDCIMINNDAHSHKSATCFPVAACQL